MRRGRITPCRFTQQQGHQNACCFDFFFCVYNQCRRLHCIWKRDETSCVVCCVCPGACSAAHGWGRTQSITNPLHLPSTRYKKRTFMEILLWSGKTGIQSCSLNNFISTFPDADVLFIIIIIIILTTAFLFIKVVLWTTFALLLNYFYIRIVFYFLLVLVQIAFCYLKHFEMPLCMSLYVLYINPLALPSILQSLNITVQRNMHEVSLLNFIYKEVWSISLP